MSQYIFSNTFWNLSRNLSEVGEINEYVLEFNPNGLKTSYTPDQDRKLYDTVLNKWAIYYDFMNINTDELPSITITASSVLTLKDFMSTTERKGYMNYTDAIQMIMTLGNQQIMIQENGISVPYIDPKNVIVINKSIYLYLGDNYVFKNGDGSIPILKPYKRDYYFSPELMNIRALPSNISDKSWIYSFAAIIIRYMYQQKIDLRHYDYRNPTKFQNYVGEIIQSIESTKLYYFLKRCLESESSRTFLFI